MTALHAMTARELSDGFASGDVDPPAVVEACLERVERHNPELNAIVALDAEAARSAARESRERWRAGRPLSPLDGVPVTIKDNLIAKGFKATWGSRLYAQFEPTHDELAVARLRASGAILIGKTNTPELALAGYTSNEIFGSTGNPWRPSLTPGGSSGGAVAAVMSGMAPLALATDAGGSIRRPASHAGCVGLKPSVGVTPRRNGFPALAHDFQTIGPLARSVADLEMMLACLSGRTAESAAWTFGGCRIAAVCSIGDAPVDPEIAANFDSCVSRLRALSAEVSEIDCPFEPDGTGALFLDVAAAGVAAAVSQDDVDRKIVGASIRDLHARGRDLSARELVLRLRDVTEFRWRLHDFFENYDFMLTPTTAALPWRRDEPFPATIADMPASPRASAIYTTFVNVAGLPALSFPHGLSNEGLPIGMQLVGPAGADQLLLKAGRCLETEIDWPRLAPIAG